MDFTSTKYSIFFSVLMILSGLFFSFWVTLSIFIIALLLLPNFYIGVVILFIMDSIYSFELFKIGPFYGIMSIYGILIYFIILYLKKNLFILKK